ncbi:MAG TPA: hypothetical protein PK720_02375 [bacterium]|nr:hypothetical protein [bacterium]
MNKQSKNIAIVVGVLVIAVGIWYVVSSISKKPLDSTNQGTNNQTPPVEVVDPNWKKYSNDTYTFSIEYPIDFIQNENYIYQALGPGKDIKGVAFNISEAHNKGTNLSSDSYFSVEQLPGDQECIARNFISNPLTENTVEENGHTYSVVTGGDAAAGNRYEDTVFATKINSICYGLRLMVHTTVIENYEPGTIKEYDRQKLVTLYNRFRSTFKPFNNTEGQQ